MALRERLNTNPCWICGSIKLHGGNWCVACKEKARKKTHRLIQSKKLVRPFNCEGCGRQEPVQAHHWDYNCPEAVSWYCPNCHFKEHNLRLVKS